MTDPYALSNLMPSASPPRRQRRWVAPLVAVLATLLVLAVAGVVVLLINRPSSAPVAAGTPSPTGHATVAPEGTCRAVIAPRTVMTTEIVKYLDGKPIDKPALQAATDHVAAEVDEAIPELSARLHDIVTAANEVLMGLAAGGVESTKLRDAGLYIANYCGQYATG